MNNYLYHDSESWEIVSGNRYQAYGTGTLDERKASPEDVRRYAGRSSDWIQAIPHILSQKTGIVSR